MPTISIEAWPQSDQQVIDVIRWLECGSFSRTIVSIPDVYFAAMSNVNSKNFQKFRPRSFPIGLFVRVRLISGYEIEAQVVKIETTALGTFLHVEFGQEVANVTSRQIIGFYDFCFLRARRGKTYAASR